MLQRFPLLLKGTSKISGGKRGCLTHTGGRESVLVEVRRNRRCSHQTVHDDSRMAEADVWEPKGLGNPKE
jgi:hypothetical protein